MRTHVWLALNVAMLMLPSVVTWGETPQLPNDGKLRIIVFGAHPDDAEVRAGGSGILWSAAGHHVKLVSVTNGDIGHTRMAGAPLALRRMAEVRAASKILGTTSQVLDIHDGELLPTLENRRTITRLIREWNADIVISHRPNDYHPDHRYVATLVQDAGFIVTVPFFCPDTPALQKNPVFLYGYDAFQRPNPFRPDIVVSLDSVIEKKMDALMVMESQFVEVGIGGANIDRQPFPTTPAEREAVARKIREMWKTRFAAIADKGRAKLCELYGEEIGNQVRYAEAFEICEYGHRPTADEIRQLFPFLPEKK